ncbi:MAG: hypothetical protein Q9202_007087 [Teloschistes flavicans]
MGSYVDGVEAGVLSVIITLCVAGRIIPPAPLDPFVVLTLLAAIVILQPTILKLRGMLTQDVVPPSTTYTQPALVEDPTRVFRVPYSDDSDSEESRSGNDSKGSLPPLPNVDSKGSLANDTTKDGRYMFARPYESSEDSLLSGDLEGQQPSRPYKDLEKILAKYNIPKSTMDKTDYYRYILEATQVSHQTRGDSHTCHKANCRGFLALPTELGIKICEYLQYDKQSLKSLRLVCSRFNDLASPKLFGSVHFRRSKEDWVQLYAFCASTQLIQYIKVLKLKIGYPPDGVFPRPPLGLQNLTIESLEIYDYRCLRIGDVRLPVGTQFLTSLYIDTRGVVCDKTEYLRSTAMVSTWKPLYSGNDFQNLQSLTITQEPDVKWEMYRGDDVVFLLQGCQFKKLRDLRLHFITTRPEYLVSLLEACISDKLELVRLFMPVWSSDELRGQSVERFTSRLKDHTRISFEQTPPWTRRKYTEDEFIFMIENDILPRYIMQYVDIKPGESEVLDRWHELRTGRNPAKERKRAQLIASRASVYDPLPEDA